MKSKQHYNKKNMHAYDDSNLARGPINDINGEFHASKLEINPAMSIRLIKNADHMQIGTLMYSMSTNDVVSQKFIPIFPFLYDELNGGRLLSGAEFYLPRPPHTLIPL